MDFLYFIAAFVAAFFIKKYLLKSFWGAPLGILAGSIALIFGEECIGVFKFSENINHYISFLLCIIFASFPLSVERIDKEIIQSTKSLWKYSILQHSFQWGIGILIASFIAGFFTSNTAPYLGSILPAGFAGGHGSSAVVGHLFAKKGYEEVFSLSMMMATIGSFFSLFGGLLWISKKDFSEVTPSKVFIPHKNTFILFFLIIILSYLLKLLLNKILFFNIPMLATGVISGLVFRFFLRNISYRKGEIDNFNSLTTTLLVALGIGAIKIYIIEKYILLITLLSLVSIFFSILFFKFIGVKKLGKDSFEKSLFTWGWSTGGIVFGLSLVEMIKDKKNKNLLQVLALSYLLISPFEIGLILSMPHLLLTKLAPYIGICLFCFALIILFSFFKRG